jgi:hypothetical protein
MWDRPDKVINFFAADDEAVYRLLADGFLVASTTAIISGAFASLRGNNTFTSPNNTPPPGAERKWKRS